MVTPQAQQIRSARLRAGLTQAELAKRLGTSQPAINRYERGTVTPRPAMLARILAACRGKRPSDALMEHRREVLEILSRDGAGLVLVFGSVARGEDTADSDIDILVDHLDPHTYVWGIPRARDELEELLGFPVDLGEVGSLKPTVAVAALEDACSL